MWTVHRSTLATAGLLSPCSVLKGRKLSEQSIVRELCSDLVSKHIASPHLLATMVDLYGEEAVAGRKDSLDKALEVSPP